MKDPSGLIRTWLYGVLNTKVSYKGSTVPVYSIAPKDTTMPYILLGQQSGDAEINESTKDTWITRQSFTIDIYTSGKGNRTSYVPLNTISDSVIKLVRTRSDITITGFNVVSLVVDSILTDVMDFGTKIVLIKIINITLIMEES